MPTYKSPNTILTVLVNIVIKGRFMVLDFEISRLNQYCGIVQIVVFKKYAIFQLRVCVCMLVFFI